MTRFRTISSAKGRPPHYRRAVSLVAILGLLVSGLMPLAQAAALSSGTGTLLAEICSPNGIRYVEIDLGAADRDAPPAPPLGALDHCPGCLVGGGLAVLPLTAVVLPPMAADGLAAVPGGSTAGSHIEAGFRPRAPPTAS